MDDKFHAQIINQANKAAVNSLEAEVADVVSNGKATSWRASEHSQRKPTVVNYHEYPNKKLVTKAINGQDVIFSDKSGKLFQVKIKHLS